MINSLVVNLGLAGAAETRRDFLIRIRLFFLAVLASSNGNHLGGQFWLPFIHTADYLGTGNLGDLHTISDQDNKKALDDFTTQLSVEP